MNSFAKRPEINEKPKCLLIRNHILQLHHHSSVQNLVVDSTVYVHSWINFPAES